MTKKIYLETLKSALGRSIYHYYCEVYVYTRLFLSYMQRSILKFYEKLILKIYIHHQVQYVEYSISSSYA